MPCVEACLSLQSSSIFKLKLKKIQKKIKVSITCCLFGCPQEKEEENMKKCGMASVLGHN